MSTRSHRRPRRIATLLPLALVALPLTAAEPILKPGPTAPLVWVDARLAPVGERDSVQLLIALEGRRVARVYVESLGIAGIDASGLEVDETGVRGRLVVGHEPRRMNRTLVPKLSTRMPLELAITFDGDRLRGTFAGTWPHPKSLERPVPVEGTITGRRRTERALTAANGLPKDAAWPSWLGPNQNFSSGPATTRTVADLHDARLIWVSEWIGPTESGSQRYGACVACPPAAGGASPIVANGRVYQFRFRATGDDLQETHLDKVLAGEKGRETRAKLAAVGWTLDDLKNRWAIRADEELLCLDAATGKTLWTVTWPGEGLNLYDHKCSLTNHTGVAADGRVYVFGALGRVRCIDGESGQTLWATDVPGYADVTGGFLQKCLDTKNVHAPTRSFCHGLNVSGDTVVAPDGISQCGLVGLDAKTGKVLWHVKDRLLGKAATPLAWNGDGRHFVLAANAAGAITCLDAKTGEIAWQVNDAGDNEYTPLLVDDRLIAHRLDAAARERAPRTPDDGPHSAPGDNYGQVACWRLSARGTEIVWEAPAAWGAPSNSPIGSTAGGLVCFRGNFSYHLVDPRTGKRLASRHLTAPVRWDEGHLLALPDRFVLHPDSQHGVTKFFPLAATRDAKVGPLWQPPHPPATTYQSAMSHAWADGRLFIRGADALYCYDLRAASRAEP